MHFINRFGHGEKLVPITNYVPPSSAKPPAARV
jgi:hypothetical protein